MLGKTSSYGVEHRLRVLEHEAVLEPHYPDAERLQHPRPLGVVGRPLRREVYRPVQLYGELLGRAVEVEHVGTDGVLAAEAASPKLSVLEERPERGLGGRAVGAEVPARRRVLREVVDGAGHERPHGVAREAL